MIKLIQGDCLEVMATLEENSIDAVITDPPYGGNYDTKYTRFTGGATEERQDFNPIIGDDTPFDPSPWLEFPIVVMFGFNVYSDKLPPGTLLVWQKRRNSKLGKFLSDCEIAWMKGGKGIYLFNHEWDGFMKASERGQKRQHPTQKPVALMEWVMDKAKVPVGATVLDPYMGSGGTGIACVNTGRSFIGIEVYPDYFSIASTRIQSAIDTQSLPHQIEMILP